MEEAAELGNYLPLSFKSPKEQEYIEFLWDAFDTNYTHGKYQFAFLAYHVLTMSFVYFNIWQINQAEPKDFAMGLIGFGKDIEKSLLEATSPFVFSTVNERSTLRFLKLIACDNGDNAAGKTGYIRILKSACRARRQEQILGERRRRHRTAHGRGVDQVQGWSRTRIEGVGGEL